VAAALFHLNAFIMVTISKPLSAGQARAYHEQEFQNARENYYTTADRIPGRWHGQLARAWGLTGEVDATHFARLAEGQHPDTGAQQVQHRAPAAVAHQHGPTMTHRAGWDATFSAPKSVSLTALVGGDDRVREAHRASVLVALDELEHAVQARLGDHPAQTTGTWVAARFEHDSARPVDGYAAPQLHSHVVVFNLTRTAEGEIRPVQPRELYKTQQLATAIYRSELAIRLQDLGYEIDRGASGQPEIRGYTEAYLDASSPRRQQIEDQLARGRYRGAEAAEIAAHQTRDAKVERSHEEMQRQHQALAEAHGHQPARVVEHAHARAHGHELAPERSPITAQAAVTFARDRNFEREAVVEERALLRDALQRGMGDLTLTTARAEIERRLASGEFLTVDQDSAGRALTTREMQVLEQDTINRMRAGHDQAPALVGDATRAQIAHEYAHLNTSQRAAIDQLLGSHDQVLALEGVAGAGKTTALAAVRDAAEREGYHVEGFAPTSRAAQQLAEAGLGTSTLQRHLAQPSGLADPGKRLYVLDESSLTSTRQMHEFLRRLTVADRVLLVGDVRQHQAVEAGRPYQQLQEAGLAVARLDQIVRQSEPALRAVVEQLAHGEIRDAMQALDQQGRVHEIPDRDARLQAVAREYIRSPDGTLVVSPDNASRVALNEVIHEARQAAGQVQGTDYRVRVLVPRQEVTGADRQWAAQYQSGDIARYSRGSSAVGLEAGEYARVVHVNADKNEVTVRRHHGARVTYDPRRLAGVTLYREAERAFASGDRVQFTAPDRERHIANRELGTIEHIDRGSRLSVRLDSGRTLAFTRQDQPHLDYGYAVTSHSSQGQTADRVLVHVDLDHGGEHLINQRLAYVALSRGRSDAQVYTNDKTQLREALSRDVSHRKALDRPLAHAVQAGKLDPASDRERSREQTINRGIGL
jgi:conjugative relaxase-like TrwC/TraI family protein